jgi:hypothetical protein
MKVLQIARENQAFEGGLKVQNEAVGKQRLTISGKWVLKRSLSDITKGRT